MSFSFGFAIYFVLWWTVLFAVLPIGVRTQGEDGEVVPGTPASAPTRPRLVRVAVITTIVTCILFGALWVAIRLGLLDLQQLLGRNL